MSRYTEFFLRSTSHIVQYETIELYHPDFSQTYRIVRNCVDGLTAITELGDEVEFMYRPIMISNRGIREDLDQALEISFGDVGTVLPTELDRVREADNFETKPTLLYRTYRSDELDYPLFGPLRLEVQNLAFNEEGVTISATAPMLNVTKTGEIYQFERFPMLRGFL